MFLTHRETMYTQIYTEEAEVTKSHIMNALYIASFQVINILVTLETFILSTGIQGS